MKQRFIGLLFIVMLLGFVLFESIQLNDIEPVTISITEIPIVIEEAKPEPEPEVIEPEIIVEELEPEIVIEESEPEIDEWISLGEFKLTAYCACEKCCGKSADGVTATGTTPVQGRTIAVDPKKIPYGTCVKINDHEYIAEDCGGAIKQNRIDIYFDSHHDALVFGVQYAEVFIKREKDD